MNYLKRLETIFIVIVILILGVAYGILNSKPSQPLPKNSSTQNSESTNTSVSYRGEDGKNVLEILKAKYIVQTKSFGDLGEYVESINGVKPDATHFWSFYVNGQQAQVGASAYMTKSSETIEWKLEEIK